MIRPGQCLEGSSLRKSGVLSAVVALGLVWYAVIRILWNDWRIDPQYSYGILVPLLVLGLLLKRWEDRPPGMALHGITGWWASFVLLAGTTMLALIVPIAEANPDWRPLGLLASLSAVTITLGMIFLTGGKPWLRHFSFPVCFFLIAVPWPRNFEQSFMAVLMSWNTATTLELLHWFGYEAMSRGNLILIPSGVLGIEEACSGIRSLQSGLMVALFFGEVFRLLPLRRLLLLAAAILAALLGNIIRSFLLALVASREGISAIASWHDPAGMMVLLITFGSVFGCALLWKQTKRPSSEGIRKVPSPYFPPRWVSAAVGLLLLVSLLGAECWFRVHEGGSAGVRQWDLHPRTGEPGVAPVAVSPRTLRMLFYPEGFSEHWTKVNREQGQVFYFRWPPGRTAVQAVSMHNPEVCLSSIGMHMVRPLAAFSHEGTGVTIPFRAWLFEQNGRPVYVYNALLEDGGAGGATEELEDSPVGRLRSLLSGHRNRGQRMVEVAFWNMPDEAAAREALSFYLREAMITPSISSPMNQ